MQVQAIGKFPNCCCCNCLGERRWEGKPRSHFHKPIASACHVTPRCEHTLHLKCFVRLLVNILQARQRFLNGIHVSRPAECQLKTTKRSGVRSTSNTQENVEKMWELIHEDRHWTIRELAHAMGHLWSSPENLNRKFEHVLLCHEVCFPILDKWSTVAACKHASRATREG
jgi:hypothetical protein